MRKLVCRQCDTPTRSEWFTDHLVLCAYTGETQWLQLTTLTTAVYGMSVCPHWAVVQPVINHRKMKIYHKETNRFIQPHYFTISVCKVSTDLIKKVIAQQINDTLC